MYTLHSKPGSPVRVTVVGKYQDGTLTLAVARCSKDDSFNRKKGRLIAKGRLKIGRYYEKFITPEPTGEEWIALAEPICEKLQNDHKVFHPEVSKKISEDRNIAYRKILTDKFESIKSRLEKAGGPIKRDAKIIDLVERNTFYGPRMANPEE